MDTNNIRFMVRRQTPSVPSNWLYRDLGEDRAFSKVVYLGINDTDWDECTDDDKTKWEEEHKKEEEKNEDF